VKRFITRRKLVGIAVAVVALATAGLVSAAWLVNGNTITVNFPSSTGAGLVADEFSNVAAGAVSAPGALTAGQPSGFTALTAQSLPAARSPTSAAAGW
jgi:hypothetical protein